MTRVRVNCPIDIRGSLGESQERNTVKGDQVRPEKESGLREQTGSRTKENLVDPIITSLVAAIAAGAAAGLKKDAAKAVRDAYGGLKDVLTRRYSGVDLRPVEQRPTSRPKKESLAEDLSEAGAANDSELLALARVLTEAIQVYDPEAAGSAEVDLKDVKAKLLAIERVTGHHARVRVEGSDVEGEFRIIDIHGARGPDPNS